MPQQRGYSSGKYDLHDGCGLEPDNGVRKVSEDNIAETKVSMRTVHNLSDPWYRV